MLAAIRSSAAAMGSPGLKWPISAISFARSHAEPNGWLSSGWAAEQKALLSPWPVDCPRDWVKTVNTPMTGKELDRLTISLKRGRPYGDGASDGEHRAELRIGKSIGDASAGAPVRRLHQTVGGGGQVPDGDLRDQPLQRAAHRGVRKSYGETKEAEGHANEC
jgi:hypothetical protein